MLITSIFSSAVFGENLRYCYSLGVVILVAVVVGVQKLWHFVIYLFLLKIFNRNSEYVFTIQRETHTFKGKNSRCIFSELCPFLVLDLLSSVKNSTSESWYTHAVLLLPLWIMFSKVFLVESFSSISLAVPKNKAELRPVSLHYPSLQLAIFWGASLRWATVSAD